MKKHLSAVFILIGVLLFVAMGMDIWPHHGNLLTFLGIAAFLIAGFFRKIYGDCCTKKGCDKSDCNN